MNQAPRTPAPGWYWIIAVLALLWNLMGCTAFLMEVFAQEAMMESMTDQQKEWARSIPVWIFVVYFLAVTTGAAGSVGLLMRKAWSLPLFAVCLVAVIIQMVYTMLILGGLQAMGPSGLVMPVLVIVFASALLWFSWLAKGKSWLV